MAGERMQPMPMSPRQSPAEIGSAAVQWACTRRGRNMVVGLVLCTILMAITGFRHHETISSTYQDISAHYGWRPHFPNLPSIIHTPFKHPSNTTLRLENGEISNVPSHLKKTTPNFHLLMPAERDNDDFCKTSLSAMLLNYPPPTVVNLYTAFESDYKWELDTLNTTYSYLNNPKHVQDEDLVLIVDGRQAWFQLPSDVIITQYKRVLKDANVRLMEKYGVNKEGYQKFNQTIIFGAEKMCENDDIACRYVPKSILPSDLYGTAAGHRTTDSPAKFLDSKAIMGPAGDLKVLYEAALQKFEHGRSQAKSVQSVFATIFGEQQLRRDAVEPKPAGAKLKEFLSGAKSKITAKRQEKSHITFRNNTQYEFSIGLDYTHTLFQPFIYCSEDELVPLKHDNRTDNSKYHHSESWAHVLALPKALAETKPPFWRPDLIKHNPSPNDKPAYIEKLEFSLDLDGLPKRKTPWSKVSLLQNTYTGAVPAILLNNPMAMYNQESGHAPTANVSWHDLWYAPHKRALLRGYFRAPQSPNGYHNSLVGGDRSWDVRGGRGGVWTADSDIWLPWGEVDGVCGSLGQMAEVFRDNKGVWLHETDVNGEEDRMKEEQELAKKVEEERAKQEEIERINAEQVQRQQENTDRLIAYEAEKAAANKVAEDEEERQRLEVEALIETTQAGDSQEETTEEYVNPSGSGIASAKVQRRWVA